MTTEILRDERIRRLAERRISSPTAATRRRHAAETSRIAVAGAGTTLMLALVAGMARSAQVEADAISTVTPLQTTLVSRSPGQLAGVAEPSALTAITPTRVIRPVAPVSQPTTRTHGSR